MIFIWNKMMTNPNNLIPADLEFLGQNPRGLGGQFDYPKLLSNFQSISMIQN
jgi:hypothetical protein